MNDDAQLVEAAQAGDSAAYGRLVQRYQDRLYNSVFRLVGGAEDARDVVQEALVQAFVKLDTFRGASAFYTWLYRIAFNLAMSHARRRRPTVSLEAARTEQGVEPVDAAARPEASAMQREQQELVHVSIQALSEEYRQVIVLRELEGCPYDQIAQILEIPVGTVRSRIFRARLELRARLATHLESALGKTT